MQDFRVPPKTGHARRRRDTHRTLSIMLFVLVAGAVLFVALRLRPMYMEYAIDMCEDTAIMQVNTSMQQLVLDHPEMFANLVTLERDNDNKVTALTTDMLAIGQVKAQVVNDLYVELDDLEHTTVEVPLGSVLAPDFYMGRGPSVDIGMAALTNISAEFISSFTAAGINQTRHQIIIEIEAGFHMLTPVGATDIEVYSYFPVTDTVIVGTVPERYTYITGTGDEDTLGTVRDIDEMQRYNEAE